MTKAGMVRLYAMMAALALSVESYAQTVLVQGKVINLRNEPVAGATIKVEETNKQFSANVEGMFRVSLEKGKKYSLLVSSTGYNSKLVSDIDANSLNEDLVIVLEPKVVSGEAIVIRSTRRQESTVALISFQKNNTSLSNGLAADFIKRTPDKNTGEVLKRVSGASIQDNRFVIVRGLSDRYNSAMLNGALLPSTEPDKKAFSFDMLPAAMIDNIIINKTATPEYTGEFSGGLVQVNTRDIPTKRVFSVGIGFGYNNQSTLRDFTTNARNRFDWLEPSILRAIEGGVFIWAVSATDLSRPAAFLLLFAILFGHYDNLYRALQGEHKPKWLSVAGGFILGRVVLLGIFLALSWSIVPLVWYFSVLFFVVSSIQWVAGHKARSK